MLWKSKRQAIRWQDMHAQASSCEAVTLSSLKDLNSFPVENVNCINYPVGEVESMWLFQHIKITQKNTSKSCK